MRSHSCLTGWLHAAHHALLGSQVQQLPALPLWAGARLEHAVQVQASGGACICCTWSCSPDHLSVHVQLD